MANHILIIKEKINVMKYGSFTHYLDLCITSDFVLFLCFIRGLCY